MSRILLVVGLASAKSTAQPELVYLGRSGDEMRQAIARATQPRLIIVNHVHGIPKNNSRADANAAAVDSDASDEADIDATIEELTKSNSELQRLLSLAEDSCTASNARADEITAELAGLREELAGAQNAAAQSAEAASQQIEQLRGELAAALERENALTAERDQLRVATASPPAEAPAPAADASASAPATPAEGSSKRRR